MLVSIIITNHNYGRYIGECIRSCLNQSLHESLYEIIVIDDCSKDDSLKIISEYTNWHKNFKLIKNKKNLGVAKSSNLGFKKAIGKYVIRVDADDYVNKEFLRILTYFLEENPEYFSVACDYYLVNKNNVKIKKVSSRENPIACGVLYKRKKLLSLGAYNNFFRHREEEELRSRLKNQSDIITYYLNFPLYRYRMHKSNKTKHKDYIKKFKDKILKIHLKDNYKKFKAREKKFSNNIIAIIPARGGSKRLPNKNILKIWKKPMIYWAILAAKKSKYIKDIYVTSDSKKILNISKKLGSKTILRPPEISDDKAYKMTAIRHAVTYISKKKIPNIVISLQANSPDIRTSDIDRCIEKLILNNLSEVISTNENFLQNGAIRAMTYETSFQRELSTYCGFVITNTSDIHTIQELKKLEKLGKNETK